MADKKKWGGPNGGGRPPFPTRKLFKQFNPEGTEDIEEWKQRFIQTRDPTEYTAAIELLGSWQDWLKFKKEWPHFRLEILPEWIQEMEVLIRSEALKTIIRDSLGGKPTSTSSAKWIVEGNYKPKAVGRNTVEQNEKENAIRQRVLDENEDEVARVINFVKS